MAVVEDEGDESFDMDIAEDNDQDVDDLHLKKKQKLVSNDDIEHTDWRLSMLNETDLEQDYDSTSSAILNAFEKTLWQFYQRQSLGRGRFFSVSTDVCFEKNGDEDDGDGLCKVSKTGMVCMALGTRVYLFSSAMDHLATINLDDTVDVMSFNQDASFLVIGDR
ncbi:hypothetical protein HDU67_004527, partial [Dinochytrium kinnereticum]